ncbi:MAG: CBS domain-containing protein [Clostridium sp.]|jgi:CBS domain-containing protein|uniref:CBS domain-containing protein n=1 Tax=Clostridium sp. TaxID=1506 RepID=UPI0025B850F2|nr:CBS domain-containing protein [Clostridium sp.]MCH3963084.1 CBS domain-containing protein [Clostridium sp.]MCI1716453.1 CBS domain-containing protein [Clostridium sp.]MCI1800793.1 CBS domain-containing protein [Clostridium sp.]MCI1814552.1 CBS domain-containing protein [Clostridium sp.]MCI1871462.1 CBS domain-containing protein [Clostridium sp.]
MNIAFFLTPKKDVVYESPDSTMMHILKKMETYRYTAIPLVDKFGKYKGTITEGDLLWKLKNSPHLTFENTDRVLLKNIERNINNRPVHINSDMKDLISLAENQNFVPVLDDNEIFIGIIKRSDIINYCYREMLTAHEKVLTANP